MISEDPERSFRGRVDPVGSEMDLVEMSGEDRELNRAVAFASRLWVMVALECPGLGR